MCKQGDTISPFYADMEIRSVHPMQGSGKFILHNMKIRSVHSVQTRKLRVVHFVETGKLGQSVLY